MTVWLPYTAANSGSTVFVQRLGEALAKRGIETKVQEFPHGFQYLPDFLRRVPPPKNTRAAITNTWNGFAFHRAGLTSICIEHLFVLDPALDPYKSFAQRVFHERILRRYLAKSYNTATHVVAVSDYTREAAGTVFPATDIRTIRNGIDADFFHPEENATAPPIDSRPFRIGFAGNQTFRKGADLLVPIMERLGDRFELWHTGPELTNLPDAPRRRIRALGKLDQTEIRAFYRDCDALLAPTRLEGLPLTVIEAQSCGLPVVATDASSLPEAVAHDETGFICPVDDVEAMARALAELAADGERLTRMSKAARTRAKAEFGFTRMVDAYVALLGDML